MNMYTGIDDKEIGLMSLLDDLIVLHNGERYTINGYIIKLQNNWNELKKWLIQLQKFKGINQQGFSWGVAQEVLDKMQELEER